MFISSVKVDESQWRDYKSVELIFFASTLRSARHIQAPAHSTGDRTRVHFSAALNLPPLGILICAARVSLK